MSLEARRKSPGANSNGNTSGSSLHGHHYTWADEVARAERKNNSNLESTKSSDSDVSLNNVSSGSNSQDRQITVEFIDDVNEEKFKRLLQEEKIKTPFKRRHENDSRSNSPVSSNSDEGNDRHDYKEEKRQRHGSYCSSSSSSYPETDAAVLVRRQKQIDYGKNTTAYERYVEQVPRSERTRDHPRTPDKYGKYSRRAFDGLVKIWRKQLHHYDPPEDEQANAEDSSSDDSD